MLKKYHNAIVCMLVVVMIYSPSMVCAQSPTDSADVAAKPKPDLDYITPQAVAGVVVYPRAC